MSNLELDKELEFLRNNLKIANAKISACNHTLGTLMGENNDLKATNILYQEKERELINQNNSLLNKISELENKISLNGCAVSEGAVHQPIDSCE